MINVRIRLEVTYELTCGYLNVLVLSPYMCELAWTVVNVLIKICV